jgi:Hint domain
MSTTTAWIDGNGNYGAAENWSLGVPSASDDAEIVGSQDAPLTVTVDATGSVDTFSVLTLTTEFATLDVNSGSLTLLRASMLDAVDLTGGTLEFANGGTGPSDSLLTGTVSMTGGKLKIDDGSLTLAGPALLSTSVIGGGTLVVAAGADVDGLVTGDGAVLDNRGIVSLTLGTLELGFNAEFSSSTFRNETGATFLLLGDGDITTAGYLGTFTNDGLFEKQIGVSSTVAAHFVNVGVIDVAAGTLHLTGAASTYAGEIDGTGTVDFAATSQIWQPGLTLGIQNIRISTSVTLATDLAYGGTLDASNAQIHLADHPLTLTATANLDDALVTNGGSLVTRSVQAVDSLTIGDGATLDNQGTETLGGGTLDLGFNGEIYAAALLNEKGATFEITGDGGVTSPSGGTTISNAGVFEKSGGTGTSTIAAIFHNTGTFSVDSGAVRLSAGVTNNGTAEAFNGGSLIFDGSFAPTSGKTGIVILASHGGASFESTVSTGETIAFSDDTGALVLGRPSQFAAGIDGFQGSAPQSDSIDLPGLTGLIATYAGTDSSGVLTLKQGTTTEATLHFDGDYTINSFAFAGDGSGGTLITATGVRCYRRGTHILTEFGEVAVEDLRAGDRVRSALTGALVPITWIGSHQVECPSHPGPGRQIWPVRVAAGAFGAGRPHTDLFLSPDHAVYFESVLIPIRHLVNGRTIHPVPAARVQYYHIELPRHDVVLAEGLPAESLLDLGDGSATAKTLRAPAASRHDMPRAWEALACAPLVVTGPKLTAVRALTEDFARWLAAA